MQVSGIVSLDPLADVEKAWNERIQAGLKGTIWVRRDKGGVGFSGGC